MDKKNIKSYLEEIQEFMRSGKFIYAFEKLQFIIKNLEVQDD